MCSAFYYLNYLVQLYKLNEEGKQISTLNVRFEQLTHTPSHECDSDAIFLKCIFSTISVKQVNQSGEIILGCKCWTFRTFVRER